jgi:PAS domain S-box-containing protein
LQRICSTGVTAEPPVQPRRDSGFETDSTDLGRKFRKLRIVGKLGSSTGWARGPIDPVRPAAARGLVPGSANDRSGELARRPGAKPAPAGLKTAREQRYRSTRRRVAAANARDSAAQARDVAAAARDVAAALRDNNWEAQHPVLEDGRAATGAEILLRAAKYRSDAAADRAAAAAARASAAAERKRAAADREHAARDRILAQMDRDALLRQLAYAESDRPSGEQSTAPDRAQRVGAARPRRDGTTDGWRETFWQVFGLSQNPMMLLDQDRRIVALNHALVESLGYTRERMLGLRLDTFYDQIEWELLDTHWRAFQRRGTFDGDRTMVNADGERVKVHYAAHWAQIAGRSLALYVALHTRSEPRRIKTPNLRTGESLSPRELEVLGWVALGRRAYEIAAELGIASTTVESHVRSAMRKVGARSQAQLVAIACANDVLDVRPLATAPAMR